MQNVEVSGMRRKYWRTIKLKCIYIVLRVKNGNKIINTNIFIRDNSIRLGDHIEMLTGCFRKRTLYCSYLENTVWGAGLLPSNWLLQLFERELLHRMFHSYHVVWHRALQNCCCFLENIYYKCYAWFNVMNHYGV